MTASHASSSAAAAADPAAATQPSPIAVRTVAARVRTALAPYGGPAVGERPLPASVVSLSREPAADAAGSAAARVAVWRADVDATLPQPEGRAARFQEQETYDPDLGLSVDLTVPTPVPGERLLCLYQHKEWWMRPLWADSPAAVPARTQMVLYRTADGSAANGCNTDMPANDRTAIPGCQRWAVLLAVSADDARADLAGIPGTPSGNPSPSTLATIRLIVSTNRVGRTSLRDTVLYTAVADDPYAAVDAAVAAAARRNGILTRARRPFPPALAGLGWCTWDSLGRDVSERVIVEKMEEFRAKRVPVSWVLIDDGWSDTDRERETLRGFDADRERFPQGLAHTVDLLKSRYGVRSVGVWQAFQGYWSGVDEDCDLAAAHADDLTRTSNGCLIPAAGEARAARFWDAWDARLADAGVGFVKVDSQSSTSVMTYGVEGFGESSRGRHAALDAVTDRRFAGALINCMGMAPEDFWHRPSSPITRSSDDYLPHDPSSLGEHLMQNAYCSLLMGGLYHCDWDMFWTDHPHARAHALMRLLSGGPVYCSDAAGRTDASVLDELFSLGARLAGARSGSPAAPGALPRPDMPSRPIVDSLLSDPTASDRALGVEARFGDDRIVMFVGLAADRTQSATIAAAPGESLTVADLTDAVRASAAGASVDASAGERILRAGERLSYELRYGDIRILRVRDLA